MNTRDNILFKANNIRGEAKIVSLSASLCSKFNLLFIVYYLLFIIPCSAQTQLQRHYLRDGNKAYEKKDYDKAQYNYRKALDEDDKNYQSHFNLGDALYKKGDYNGAAAKFETAVSHAKNNKQKAEAYHNLGNSYLKSNKYEQSVDAYKQALKNNPNDKDTKYNLSLALSKLQKEKEQNKKDKKNKDKQDKKDNKDKKGDDKKDDKNKGGDKDQKDKGKQDDKNKGDKDKDKQKGDQGDKDKKQNQKPEQEKGGMSKEEAERILNALKGEEQKVQKRLLLQKAQEKKTSPKSKQW